MKSFKMKNRMLAALLCLVTVGGIAGGALLQGSSTASASSTLSGISQLRSSGKEYVILEIVPDTSQAAFAWYVGGNEPVNETKLSVAYATEPTKLEESYAGTTESLQNHGFLGTNEDGNPEEHLMNYKGEVSVSDSGEISGGYENNEWFKRFVLNWTEGESEPNVTVYTVSPKDVTDTYLNLADMVVVSGGFYHSDTNVVPTGYSTDAASNLTTAVTDEIISRVKKGMPLILDRGAYNTSAGENLNSNWLFHNLLGGNPTTISSGVYGSVFYYSAMNTAGELGNAVTLSSGSRLGLSGGVSQGYLVTSDFNEPFASSMTGSGGPFNDVLKSIQSENVSRSSDNKVSEDVTMASVVRYLVAGIEVETPQEQKTSVTILSLQPGDASGSATSDKVKNDSDLSAPSVTAKVSLPTSTTAGADDVSWAQLELWTGVAKENITVVQQSINDFIASGESISGTYDMIYIGNDISGGDYGLYTESAQFGTALGGGSSYYGAIGSGNSSAGTSYTAAKADLTTSKAAELNAFVNSGRPVILAPYLCAGLNVKTSDNTPSTVSVDESSNMYTFLSNAASKSNVMRQDLLIAGTDGDEETTNNEAALEACVAAVNIPTPEIEFSNLSPLVNTGNSVTVDAKGNLEYIFKVTNDSQSGLSYRLSAMLDVDGDGVYETDATTFDTVLFESLVTTAENLELLSGSAQRQSDAIYSNLSEDQYYRLKVTLPDWISGSVSWRLSVDSTTYSGASAVAQNSVYVKDARTISVLQVKSVTQSELGADLTLEEYSGVEAKLASLLATHGITMSFNTVDTKGVISENLNAYDVVLVGYFSDASDSEVAKKLSLYNGNLIFANSSMNLPYLDGSASGSHPFAPKVASNLASMIEENYTTSPYIVNGRVGVNDFLMYYGSTYFTNMTLKGSDDLEFWIDVITAVDQMSIKVEKPDVFDGLLQVSSNSSMNPLIGSSGTVTEGTTFSTIDISTSDVNDASNLLPVYFKIDKDINNFHVGVRWKAGPTETDWYWDSNYYKSTTEGGTNPLISIKAYTTVNNSEIFEVMGDTFDSFATTDTSTLTFRVELLPDMKNLLLKNETNIVEIYIVTEDNSEVSASFTINVSEGSNVVEGNNFYYMEYYPDIDGSYNYIVSKDKYLLEAYLYEKSTLGYQKLVTGEERKATHWLKWETTNYLPYSDDEDDVNYVEELPQYATLYVYSEYKLTSAPTTEEVPDIELYMYNENIEGNYEYLEGTTTQRYSKDTNMHIDDYTDKDGNTAGGTLFQIG